ncbi:MAG: ABC transporter substrate-binding protein [Candidatus Promineifilaceae bacterium]
MNRYKYLFRILFLLVIFVILLMGCTSPAPSEIKIGLIAPLSGEYADSTGQPAVDAVQMAVDEVNEAGGLEINGRRYTIVLITKDNQGNPETSVSAAQQLINQEGVVAIIGPMFSSNAIPVSEIAEQAGIPMISPTSTNPQTTLGKTFVFRATFIDDFQGLAMARFALEDLGLQKAAVLYDVASSYNRGLAETFRDAFKRLGGDVVAFESYTTDTNSDFSKQLTRIQETNAQALFLPNYTDDVLRKGEQAQAMGLNVTFLGSDSWEGERLMGLPAFENSFFSGHFCRDLSVARIRTFSETYEQRYGREPNGLISLSYDSAGLLFAAMQNQNQATPATIRDGLFAINYTGITGPISYDTNGDPMKSVAIWTIEKNTRGCYKMVTP